MTLLFATYVLVWPVLTLAVLAVICRAVARDRRSAQQEKRELV